ncbi:PEP-CTERM sorting domain-containing protein [Persicirhabdus sediminis]|uniref:PEP-CTERM sorting domain-containing protein n=1 Tax=Persicirhabdus sediminis TaxID=454144 RepID=A0A8J7SJ05_9BACT|nr:PEP-CTERM sorting domain-containing protein [Persicirhabdus sediminis]MBK1791009.1 PEP-CTERM sorting domain-containing protein [Persicirhabdus sediminis]
MKYTLLLLASFTGLAHSATTFIDADFEAPHVLNTAPATGSGIGLVSTIDGGSPLIVTGEPASGNALSLQTGDAVIFEVGQRFSSYEISYDLTFMNFEGTASEFTFFIDTPIIRRVDIGSSETQIFIPGSSRNAELLILDDTNYSILHEVDTAADTWEISVNGSLLYSGQIGADGVEMIRFYNIGSAGAEVKLDNLLLTGNAIPEPNTSILLFVASIGLWKRKR